MNPKSSSAILVIAFGLAACGQSGTTVSTSGGTVRASADGSTTTITGANGEAAQIATGAGAAANLPDSMPLYPGAKVTTSISGGNESQKTVSVSFETGSSVADVIAFYKGKAAALGLVEALTSSESGVTTFVATKDQMSLIVAASKGTSSTEGQITWATPTK